MASLSMEVSKTTGRKTPRIMVVVNRKREVVRLKIGTSLSYAQEVKSHIEHLSRLKATGEPVPHATEVWLRDLPVYIERHLARIGLKPHVDFSRVEECQNPSGVVYFITTPARDKVKVGFTANPSQRLRKLQTASPEELYFYAGMRGTPELERDIHRQFDRYRIPLPVRTEWFFFSQELVDYCRVNARVFGGNRNSEMAALAELPPADA